MNFVQMHSFSSKKSNSGNRKSIDEETPLHEHDLNIGYMVNNMMNGLHVYVWMIVCDNSNIELIINMRML